MAARNITACFTGHRVLSRKELKLIDKRLFPVLEELYDEGFRHFIAGGAIGFDTIAAEAVLKLKEKKEGVTLHIAIPCPEQPNLWREKEQKKYFEILEKADSSEIVSDHYFDGCMQLRNRYMVDRSSALIAFFRGSSGGTGSTCKYASKKLPIVINIAEYD